MASPASTLLPLVEHGQRPPEQRVGRIEFPEDAVQDCHALHWGLPLAIVFFAVVVVVVVTVGKGGIALMRWSVPPVFGCIGWHWRKQGEYGMMVVGCGV